MLKKLVENIETKMVGESNSSYEVIRHDDPELNENFASRTV